MSARETCRSGANIIVVGSFFQPLLFLIARTTADDLQKQVEFLKAENEMLRKRVPKKRIFLRADERATLLKLGKGLGSAIRYLITIVDYSTFRRWVRKEGPQNVRPRKGGLRISLVIREVILQIAKDTGWGYRAQANAFLAYVEPSQLRCETIIRDRDGKYTAAFDRLFQKHGIAAKPVGPRAPNLNAFIERWIQSLKHEALNHFVVFGLVHFDHIVREFVDYYHDCRPHQGIGNRLIGFEDSDVPPVIDNVEQLECESRLGGLLKTYRRAA